MPSHIATEEWQSFELRMRRRRAERLVVRAEAALESGSVVDAGNALDEARCLCPSLPSLDHLQARITLASAQSQRTPARARMRRVLAIAAGLAIVATSGAIGWRMVRTQHTIAAARTEPPASGASVIAPPAPAPAADPAPTGPSAGSSIRIETEQVPPVVISGATPQPKPVAAPAFLPARMEAASAITPPPPAAAVDSTSRVVGTSGPTTQLRLESPPPTPVDAGAIASLGKETTIPAPAPAVDRFARMRELANTPADPAPAAPETRPDPPALPPPAAAAIPAPKKPDDAALVRGILDKYADAYTRLDADAAKAVWPSVNRAALSRAFNGLNGQRIAFNDCSVDVRSPEARATCSGSATWEPKIGGGPRTDTRRWAFDLEKSGDGWIIRDARVQNR